MKKIIILITVLVSFHAWQVNAQISILKPTQGGTGIGSAVAGDVGKCLKVLTNSPFAYELGTCGGGGGSTSDFTYTVGGQGIYLTPTSTTVGLLTNASSTFVRLNSWNSTSTQATSSYLASLLAFSVSSGTSTLMGGVSAPRLAATSTTASSTFAGGVWSTGSGFRDSALNCTGYGNGGKLTTNANGQFICAADTDTDTDTTQNVPNEFTYTVGAQGIYLTPTSTSVGILTNSSSTILRLTSLLSSSTQATSTYFNVTTFNVGSGGFRQTGFSDCTGTQKVTYSSGNFSCDTDVSGAGGSGSNWLFENDNLLYITPSTTVGIIAKASSTIRFLTTINSTSTQATSSYLASLLAFSVSSGTSTLMGGASAPRFAATSTTASSTFAGGVWVTGSGFRDSLLDCTAYGNGGKLTTNANGQFICAADTDTTGSGNIPSEFTYTVGAGGIYLTPTSTSVGLLTVSSSTFTRMTAWNSTSTQATSTFLAVSTLASTSQLTVSNAMGVGTTSLAGLLRVQGGNIILSTGQYANYIASTTASAATYNVDWDSGNSQRFFLNQNANFNIDATSSNPIDGAKYTLMICQDNTGSRTATFGSGLQRWTSGGTTTIDSTANECTLIGMIYDSLYTVYRVAGSSTNIKAR